MGDTVAQQNANLGTWGNMRRAVSVPYTVALLDKGWTIGSTGSVGTTISLAAASGYDPNFQCMIVNEDANTKTVAPNGLTSFPLLQGQSCLVFNDNSVWQVGKLLGGGLAGALQARIGAFTRDISLTTALSITGVGFMPKAVVFMSAGVSSNKFAGIGFDDGANSPFLDLDFTDSAAFLQNAQIIHKDALNFNFFHITSMDSDGFTLAWSKTGVPTGTATIYYLALG